MKLDEIYNNELELYRQQALRTIKQRANEWRAIAEDVLGVPVHDVRPIGSVTNKKKFTENSDIDVAFYIKVDELPKGLSEELSSQLQEIFIRYPEGDLGVINTLVFNEL